MIIPVVFTLVFVVLPFMLLIWMPGWKSLAVTAAILLGFMISIWMEYAAMPPPSQYGAPLVTWRLVAYSAAVILGIAIKFVRLRRHARK